MKIDIQRLQKQSGIIGTSEKIVEVLGMIAQVAPVDISVLITGESGTGKEVMARAIYKHSKRSNNPMVIVNCGAIPEGIIESELFGHKKGSFTGASEDRKGYFEQANKGTIFLDEIGEAPLSIQVKLLRVLQDKEFKRVGENKNIKIDVRFISATNQNLLELVKKKIFREDLYYRLNVIPVGLPPLRERKEDIPILAEGFLKRFTESNNRKIKGFTPEAMESLERFNWPGNVRELENAIERAVVLESSNVIQAKSLPESVTALFKTSESQIPKLSEEGIDLEEYIEKIEKELITTALNRTNGVLNKAASLLNLSFRSFRYRLEKYKIKNIRQELGS